MKRYTIAQWRTWPQNERWELIDGVAWPTYGMSPAPRRQHQKFVVCLAHDLVDFLEGKPCEPYVAPIDVFLSDDAAEGDTVVQPDVLVVCDPAKLADDGIHGAPDFIAEILSDSTATKDLDTKKALYERHGVREYWVVRTEGSIFAWVLKDGRYGPVREFLPDMDAVSAVLPGFAWKAGRV